MYEKLLNTAPRRTIVLVFDKTSKTSIRNVARSIFKKKKYCFLELYEFLMFPTKIRRIRNAQKIFSAILTAKVCIF
jgi:hypothetical protein